MPTYAAHASCYAPLLHAHAITDIALPQPCCYQDFFLVSILAMSGAYFTNWALNYLNYTTRIVFKSCRVLPVMAFRSLVVGARYSGAQYCAGGWVGGCVNIPERCSWGMSMCCRGFVMCPFATWAMCCAVLTCLLLSDPGPPSPPCPGLLLVIGIALFTMGDADGMPNFSYIGIILITIALVGNNTRAVVGRMDDATWQGGSWSGRTYS